MTKTRETMDRFQVNKMVLQGRAVGFVVWDRATSQRVSSHTSETAAATDALRRNRLAETEGPRLGLKISSNIVIC